MVKETPEQIAERLAKEEAAPLSEEEQKFAAFAKEGLTEAQQKKCTEMDVIQCVRGFQTYTPRNEETRKALKMIWDWREEVDYEKFLTSSVPGVSMEEVEAFHKAWPEKYFGTDKYGHVLTVTAVANINIGVLEAMNEEIMFKIIAQKLAGFTEYRKKLSAASGVQRYKYSICLDLKGCGMSLLGGRKRGMIQKVLDVAKNYFPETVWKIYCVNTPMMFRAAWAVVKPWLHPITQAKMNIINSVSQLTTELVACGMKKEQLPKCFDGPHEGLDTIDVLKQIMSDVANAKPDAVVAASDAAPVGAGEL